MVYNYKTGLIVPFAQKHMKQLIFAVAAIFMLSMALMTAISRAATSTTVVVTGNTAAAENQPGWMFNRDVTTATPYVFNEDKASIGDGSLYVLPIGANPADKFIGENFINAPVASVDTISYDFQIGSGGVDTEEEQFYMNVYANFGSSPDDKFYDCRYDVVPSLGSTSGFTTVTFDPTQAYPVTTRGGVNASPYPCPAIPADMDLSSSGSNIRAFALNVGDTSASDLGLDGYLDNVIVTLNNGDSTIYDFEALSAPEIISPPNGSVLTTAQLDKIDWTDVAGATSYLYEAYSDAGYTTLVYASGPLTSSEIPTPGTPEGNYYVRVRSIAIGGNVSAWSNGATNPYLITVDNPVVLSNKEECKKGGWATSEAPVFKNQGDCVSYFATNGRNPAAGTTTTAAARH